eukprot:2537140-Prymnesium_polylepis.1
MRGQASAPIRQISGHTPFLCPWASASDNLPFVVPRCESYGVRRGVRAPRETGRRRPLRTLGTAPALRCEQGLR